MRGESYFPGHAPVAPLPEAEGIGSVDGSLKANRTCLAFSLPPVLKSFNAAQERFHSKIIFAVCALDAVDERCQVNQLCCGHP